MPYLKNESKSKALKKQTCAGELNYALTVLFLCYLDRNRECYQTYNDIMSTLADPFVLPKPLEIKEPKTARELGSMVSFVIGKYISDNHSADYQLDLRGCFLCCSMEFYRRMAAIYEDKKMEENGDVFPVRVKEPDMLEERVTTIEREIEALSFVLKKIKEDLYEVDR